MNAIIRHTNRSWATAEEAEAVAETMRAEDPDWTYTVGVSGTGRAIVKVYDEDGEFVENL